ncbi:hypothetical protein ACSBM8_15635 [Sphingomonas sp. ASY06-1R]|uniref:hypothetical protein n=1 Tax=Sphingomonas sp. ASY06-1R TaxID=3445771 RepID=UPI003FA2AFF6
MRVATATMTTMALLLAGCGEKTAELPTEPLERAAACGVLEAANARESAGPKGELPAEAQGRVLHYAMLYASEGGAFDKAKFNAASKRMPALFDTLIKGKWQNLRPACASAYPPTQIATPRLPSKPLDAMLQCYTMADFLHTASTQLDDRYGLLISKLDNKMTPALRAAGIANGAALTEKKSAALASAAKLGQPVAVIKACEAQYGG